MVHICEFCQKNINNSKDDYYYESEYAWLCGECGEKELDYVDDIDGYVFHEDYKECYTDDELSDLEIFEKHCNDLDPEETEPDWDAINDDIRMGLL